MWLLTLCLLAADPITPSSLQDALQTPLKGEDAKRVTESIRAAFPKEKDLTKGGHLIEGSTVAFVIDAPAAKKPPRLGGGFTMLNHGRGFDMVPVGETGMWARVEMIPTDTKFAFQYELDGARVGGGLVEMPDFKYPLESKEIPDRKYGKYVPISFRSEVFHNNRTGWVYVPSAYDPKTPAALLVLQDGDAYRGEHAGTVVDNLIADGSIPVTITVGLNPGVNDDGKSNRSVEYDTLSPKYAEFLDKEVIPLLKKDYNLKDDAASHAIGGASSGGICAFTVAWERPDLFGRVCSHIGSFTNIRGGNRYPEIVRKAEKKPITRIFLQDGTNDLINQFGDWWQGNEAMYAALQEKGYDVEFLKDRSFHSYWSAGRVLADSLRATWKGAAK